jgi:CheY-like chemotaxis protein
MAKIVFCEDEVRIQKLIRTILRTTSHEVFIASDGVEGFEVIQREHPDLIFTDISMPHWDGFQLASAVKERPELAHIPIVFLTAFAQRAEVDEGYKHGAVSYLIKPFSPAELRDKVEEFITTFSMPDGPA